MSNDRAPVRLAYANALAPALAPDPGGEATAGAQGRIRGVDPARLAPGGTLDQAFQEALRVLRAREATGELGFLALPDDHAACQAVQELADSFGQWFEELVVVGIGGSSLGGRALTEALLGAHWNDLDPEAREHFPRLHFLENADPDTLVALLDRIDPRRTLFNVVSKSGSTVETLAQYMVLEEAVEAAVGPEKARGHFLFTTDPESGPLRRLARERGIPALEVPPAVGGRFSVLSPVGLLPAAATGVELEALLEGAAEMRDRALDPRLDRNPAGLLATLLWALHREEGAAVHVFMPYADRLRGVALWFQQLWGESLGKARTVEGAPAQAGPTPLAALGAVDQHSLLQLFVEGPADKAVLMLRVRGRDEPMEIPRTHPEEEAMAFLGGHSLESLLEAERRATAEALRRAGRPTLLLELDRLDARALGGLFMLLQVATVLAGALYQVNPLDQPGVEAGKRFAAGLLGRKGVGPPRLAPEDAGGARA